MTSPAREALPNRRIALLCVAGLCLAGVAAYALRLTLFMQGMLAAQLTITVVDRDFINYWMAGRLALAGEHADLFVQSVYFARL